MQNRLRWIAVPLVATVLACCASVRAEKHGRAAGQTNRLGSVNFPTSCTKEAQAVVVTGVALLHSFQYRQSEQTFAEAATIDPNCAMAQWGQAISLYQQLWEFPSEEKINKAREELNKAEELKAPTARERAYIAAANAFYEGDASLSHRAHVQAYSAVMARLHADFPDDNEGAEFYALSLVALASDNVDEAANRAKAIAILAPILRANPRNPGAAHYLIHAADTPELASQGLEAARAYAQIAPDSSHALHMPSHIFVRLGLWQETIDSNLASAESAARGIDMHLSEPHYQTHAMDFLQYAYLQSGQESAARRLTEEVKAVHGMTAENAADHATTFACRAALELHRWKEAAALPVPEMRLEWQDTIYKVRTIGAARSGDAAAAKADFEKLTEAIAAREVQQKKDGYRVPEGESLDSREAWAWLTFVEGKPDEAVKILRGAAERQESEGVDSLSIPAREMLADMLLELKRSNEALVEYRAALKISPNRFDSLYGAAQAARLAGQAKDSQDYLARLLAVAAPGADRPELREARSGAAAGGAR